ncbi:putative MFS-type transporter.10c [Ceratocystis platani]|uniref:Putative MFS-type transporter.10c n=1 Tax=Ceratocystis fimbriata f. sp. platani TaxID=88771 RepID=A0A0F8DM80_CERFI|nr:putative MFS-type transporter.10c [Ceratocystis platani]
MDNSQAQDRFAFRLPDWKPPFTRKKSDESTSEKQSNKSSSWRLGILNPPSNVDVPGSVQIFSSEGSTLPPSAAPQNPLSSRPTSQDGRPKTSSSAASSSLPPLKYTTDGTIILNPQPEDNINDPLNWPSWRRETALLALGFFCMVGGGMTPILAAGFGEMAVEYDIDMESAALTTGLFMMGLGIGSVIASPTAILYGKRPVYLAGALLFIITSIWAAVSPNYSSLIFARIFQGIAASPVECLPASTITDIFFLHERAYRIGIYMLMLLGGNNLLPLVSAVIMHNTDWSWVFWIAAMAGAVSFMLLFFLVPETFWNRLTPEQRANKKAVLRATSIKTLSSYARASSEAAPTPQRAQTANTITVVNDSSSPQQRPRIVSHSAPASMPGSVYDSGSESDSLSVPTPAATVDGHDNAGNKSNRNSRVTFAVPERPVRPRTFTAPENGRLDTVIHDEGSANATPSIMSQWHQWQTANQPQAQSQPPPQPQPAIQPFRRTPSYDIESLCSNSNSSSSGNSTSSNTSLSAPYTDKLRARSELRFSQRLKPWNGRLVHQPWWKVMIRPFVLYAYPAVAWSSIVHACSIGWLIVISELLAMIYRSSKYYNFNTAQTGLVYLSPFVGAIAGTAVAGRISDFVARSMTRRNGGLYEPEFRLIMALPITVTTVIGLIGFGWAAQERDNFMVPTFFLSVISFGCSLGSTTATTFTVDSYEQYAGEALVTLSFSKNIFHGLVFSLFVTDWLSDDGPKKMFVWIGVIQLLVMSLSIPMYMFGKRARMWTARKGLAEKL